jgi:HSP20 family protein
MNSFSTPAVDVLENERTYLLVADLPGVNKNDVKVELEDRHLWLEAKRGESAYRRKFALPDGVDSDAITAKLVDGVLNLEIPKKTPDRRQISIG